MITRVRASRNIPSRPPDQLALISGLQVPGVEVSPLAAQIPEQLFFRIGEVSRLTGVKPHVLRYWEAEFGVLRPEKSRSGQRVYRRRDVELVMRIKELLYAQRYTIEGARKMLRQMAGRSEEKRGGRQRVDSETVLDQVKHDLHSILQILDSDGPKRARPPKSA